MENKTNRWLDVYHRGFKMLRSETAQSETSQKYRAIIRKSNASQDRLETVRYRCTVETDWLDRIEAAMPDLEAAVLEDRQFIRQEGNVVPIEKAKHVSRASVEHLAKHSNLITHVPEDGGRLIPDKLYTVENLSNYAIYENRFLFMVLHYTRDFVDQRYNALEELWNSYSAEVSMKKEIHLRNRHITYELQMTEKSQNDTGAAYNDEIKKQLERMLAIVHEVSILLNTPLMQEVAKAPMLKPPITRTNMLRMDIHFKATMDLYDYLVAYVKDGFTAEKLQKTLSPFSDEVGDEFSEMVLLYSYMVSQYGRDLKADMEAVYEEEEHRRREMENEAFLAELNSMRQKLAAENISPEVYMVMLEKRNTILEADRTELKKLRKKYEELEEALRQLEEAKRLLLVRLEENDRQRNDATDQINTLLVNIDDMKRTYEETLAALRENEQALELELEEARRLLEAEPIRDSLDEEQAGASDTDDAEGGEMVSPAGAHAASEAIEPQEGSAALTETETDYKEKFYIAMACLNGLRSAMGRIPMTEDFTSQEAFSELELEYNYFYEFMNEQWKKTKKKIRQKHLWTKKKTERLQEPGVTSEEPSVQASAPTRPDVRDAASAEGQDDA